MRWTKDRPLEVRKLRDWLARVMDALCTWIVKMQNMLTGVGYKRMGDSLPESAQIWELTDIGARWLVVNRRSSGVLKGPRDFEGERIMIFFFF